MITLRFGPPRTQTPAEQQAEAQRLKTIVGNEDFGNLVQDTADRIISRWANERAPEVREQLWHQLQGLQNLLKQIDIAVENASRLG